MTQSEALHIIAKREQAAMKPTTDGETITDGEYSSLVDLAVDEVLEKLRAIKHKYSYLVQLKDVWEAINQAG